MKKKYVEEMHSGKEMIKEDRSKVLEIYRKNTKSNSRLAYIILAIIILLSFIISFELIAKVVIAGFILLITVIIVLLILNNYRDELKIIFKKFNWTIGNISNKIRDKGIAYYIINGHKCVVLDTEKFNKAKINDKCTVLFIGDKIYAINTEVKI